MKWENHFSGSVRGGGRSSSSSSSGGGLQSRAGCRTRKEVCLSCAQNDFMSDGLRHETRPEGTVLYCKIQTYSYELRIFPVNRYYIQ